MNQLAEQALTFYGLKYTRVLPVQKGYRNEIYPVLLADRSKLQLTLYKSEPDMKARILRADRVSEYASNKGLSTRTRADQRMIVFQGETRQIFGSLYHYLPGQTIAWEAYTKAHLKALGKTLSDLHAALKDFDSKDQPNVVDEQEALLDRMTAYFSRSNIKKAMTKKLNLYFAVDFGRYERLLAGCRTLPGAQQLHMDFVRGNILFENSTITGILDFEKTAVGHPLIDVARTLAFLLVDCKFKSETEIKKYFLQSGYHKRGSARLEYYPGLLERLVEFFLVYDFYKFLRHNPYESLVDNEHFARTVSILTSSRVLHYL